MALSRALLALTAATLAAALAIWRPSPLEDANLRVYDAMVRTDTATQATAHSAIVAIDEASLSRIGQWPWPRTVLATLVDRLSAGGASAIAFDVLLPEPERGAEPGDPVLAAALARAPAVAGFAFLFEEKNAPAGCTRYPLQLVERQRGEAAPRAGLFSATGAVCSLAELTGAAGNAGFINAASDRDGLLRRATLLARFGDQVYPALALAAVSRAQGGGPVVLDGLSDGSMKLTVGGRSVAVDAQGRMLLRDARPLPSRAPIPAIEVLEGRMAADAVRGRVVFVGATAMGLRDVVVTPLDRAVPGVTVHAAIADSLLGDGAYERSEFAALIEITAAIAMALITSACAAAARLRVAAVVVVLSGAAVWWICTWVLSAWGLVFSPLWPVAGAMVAFALESVGTVARERRRAERERHRRGDAQRLIVQALTTLTETRDADTGGHARRTQEYTRILATALARHPRFRAELSPERISLIATLAPLHDIGKVGVSDAVLRKPGALTPDEHAEMRRHPALGHDSLLRAEALAGVHDDEVIGIAKEIVYTHHERWDGSGYPRGLRGEGIPLSGRLVALVDAYDALVVDRAYRNAVPHAAAVAVIVESRGQHFDPDVVDAFTSVHHQFLELDASPHDHHPAVHAR